MTLQAVLATVDASWYATPGTTPGEPDLLHAAGRQLLGRRILARWLSDAAGPLLAPNAQGEIGAAAVRWPQQRLAPLLRDVGILAFAPAIRGEVRREPLRRLKVAIGNGYLLALDRTVWDGKVDPESSARMTAALVDALAAGAGRDDGLHALFDAQGRAELRTWAEKRDPGLAAWVALSRPPETPAAAHLPEKAMLRVFTHHETRAAA